MVENSDAAQRPNSSDGKDETSEISIRGILLFAGGVLVSAVLINFVLLWIFSIFTVHEERNQQPSAPWSASVRNRLPPEPRLEGLTPLAPPPYEGMSPDEMLRTYGWIDREAGVVRIPIERAMELVVDQLPARSPDARGDKEEPVPTPSRSNSGRGRPKGQQ